MDLPSILSLYQWRDNFEEDINILKGIAYMTGLLKN